MSLSLLDLPNDVLGEIVARLSLRDRFSYLASVSSRALALAYALPLNSLSLIKINWTNTCLELHGKAKAIGLKEGEQAARTFLLEKLDEAFRSSPFSRLSLARVSDLSLPVISHPELDLFVKYFPCVESIEIDGLYQNVVRARKRDYLALGSDRERSKYGSLLRLSNLGSLKLDLSSEFLVAPFSKLHTLEIAYQLKEEFRLLDALAGYRRRRAVIREEGVRNEDDESLRAPNLDRYFLAQIESASTLRHLKINVPVNLSGLPSLETLEMVIEDNLFLRGFTGQALRSLALTLDNNGTFMHDSGIDPAFICPNLNFLAPSLRSLSFSGFRIPYDCIDALNLESLSVADWVSFRSFRDQTHLTRLNISNYGRNLILGPEQFLVLEKFTLLRELEVSGALWSNGPDLIASFFESNKLPHLKSFSWRMSYEMDESKMLTFVRSLPTTIEVLGLMFVFLDVECIDSLAKRLTALTRLSLAIPKGPTNDAFKDFALRSFPKANVSVDFKDSAHWSH